MADGETSMGIITMPMESLISNPKMLNLLPQKAALILMRQLTIMMSSNQTTTKMKDRMTIIHLGRSEMLKKYQKIDSYCHNTLLTKI